MLLKLKSLGKSDGPLTFASDRLKHLAQYADLADPQAVNLCIARKKCSETYKDSLVKVYVNYARFNGIEYVKPKFRFERKLPIVPATDAILKVVSATPRKYATVFKILMETGVMPVELSNVSLADMDLCKGTLVVRGSKGHSSRAFKLRSDTLAMLKGYLTRCSGNKSFPEARWMGKI